MIRFADERLVGAASWGKKPSGVKITTAPALRSSVSSSAIRVGAGEVLDDVEHAHRAVRTEVIVRDKSWNRRAQKIWRR